MYCTIVVYHSTKFNNIDLPHTKDLLRNNSQKIDYLDNFYLVSADINTLKINMPYSEAADIDFIEIQPRQDAERNPYGAYEKVSLTRFYYVTGITMLSENTAQLNLELNAYLTWMWMNSLLYRDIEVSITATRMTPAHSLRETNTLQEPFSPAEIEEFKILNGIFQPDGRNDAWNILGATIDIDQINNTARAFVDSNGNDVLYVPSLPVVTSYTNISLPFNTGHGYELPGEQLFNNDMQTQPDTPQWVEKLQNVQSLGISDSIIDYYSIPDNWVNVTGGQAGGGNRSITELKGKSNEHRIKLEDVLPATVSIDDINNLKALKLYLTISVFSNLSGDNSSFNWEEICDYIDRVIFTCWSDPSPNGRPYCTPQYYHGVQIPLAGRAYEGSWPNFQAVQGAPWYHPQFILPGKSGSTVDDYLTKRNIVDINRAQAQAQANYNLKQTEQGFNMLSSLLGTIGAGATGNIGNITGSILNAGRTSLNQQQLNIDRFYNRSNAIDKINDNLTNLNISNNVYTPTFKTAEGSNLSLSVPNAFVIISSNITYDDMKRLDYYLTKYGYAIPPTVTTLSEVDHRGKYFSYIEASNIVSIGYNGPTTDQTDHLGMPLFLRNKLTEELQNGIRIWKVTPDPDLYLECNDPDAE